ncbi:alpha/beta fold hydrolase [Streptomyces sp. NPDC051214]|uniref:thioesterase II family protein n=1 Tax=Streptomyces sp. NPDC051214 TaxID=3155282 RepID=UPI00342F420A
MSKGPENDRTTRSDRSDWIRRFKPAEQAPCRLVCFPHAGGSASYFHGLTQRLAPDVDVLSVQYPGRQDRSAEPSQQSVTDLADQAYEALKPWTGKPLALFGHSMGAIVAFEVALRLAADGTVPLRLFPSGRRAPSRFREENVHLRDDDALLREVASLAGTDSALLADPDVRRMILPSLRADYRAIETYRHTGGKRLDCPVLALAGADDPKAPLDDVRAWGEHTTQGFGLEVFPGGHFYLNDETAAVAALLRSQLAAAAGG